MKLMVGLGNPGSSYIKTRHNIGFMCIDKVAQEYNISINKKKFDGLYNEVIINKEKVILLKPQKYMNLSGEVVRNYIDYFKIGIDDILIICDDLDTDVGRFRLRSMGSSGGHNGLKDIENNIGTQKYKRIKIGISNNKNFDTKDYVLGKFELSEMELINNVIGIIPKIISDYLVLSFDNLMNKYN